MRGQIILGAGILALLTCVSWAQEPAAPPTRVSESGIYGCPNHPDILATWPARCPTCQTALSLVEPSAAASPEVTTTADPRHGEGRERAEAGARRFPERARPHAEFRFRPYRGHGYPPRFYGRPPLGYQYYPNYGYYYNPSLGFYYYPNTGYFYNPYTGQYYSYTPGQGYFYFQIPIR